MTTNTDIKKMKEAALLDLIKEKREALRSFRFSNTGSATRNVRVVRDDKKVIAQALTELNTRTRANAPKTA